MPLPYPQNLTPDSPPYSYVQINEFWWSVIFGFADNALIRENWDVTDQQWEDEVLPAVINALDTAMNCDCISGLDFDPITGKLTFTDENDNTVEVQTAGDTFTANNYYVITENEPNADDAYCYAAHLLSEMASDDFQDMLEFIDVLEDATITPIFETFASIVDLVPFFGDLSEATIRIIDNLAEAMYDWVKENARDIQARALAAEIFYCGIKSAMESGGQGSLRAGIITAAGANLIEFGLGFVNGKWEIPDLLDVVEDAFNALDGELLGYAIVAWFLSTDAVLDVLGADRPIEAIMAHATKHAAAHDDRDCASFACVGWCQHFDFRGTEDELGWSVYQGGQFEGVNGWTSVINGGVTKLAIQISIPITEITSIRVLGDTDFAQGTEPRRFLTNVTTLYGDLADSVGNLDQTITKDFTANTNIRVQVNSNAVTGENKIWEIYVCGTGSNPFI